MPHATSTPIDWLSIAEAAAWLGVGKRSVYMLVRSGALRAVALNGRGTWRIHRQWLVDHLEAESHRLRAQLRDVDRRVADVHA